MLNGLVGDVWMRKFEYYAKREGAMHEMSRFASHLFESAGENCRKIHLTSPSL